MELQYQRYGRFIFFALLGLIFISISFAILIYNPLEIFTLEMLRLKPNSLVLSLWQSPPYNILAKGYIYNITNPEQFLNGDEKLKLNEIGPYVYREKMYFTNISFSEDGTVSFIPRRTVTFLPNLSIGDELVDTVLAPNLPLLGVTAALKDYSMLVKFGFAQIATAFDAQPFLNLTIKDYLYGYDDPLVTLANQFLPNWIDFRRFGIIDRLMALDNGSDVVIMNLNSNEGDVRFNKKLPQYVISKWNGSPGLLEWGYEETGPSTNSSCSLIQGCYLGTTFPPNMKENTSFKVYRHGFCRPVPMIYDGKGFTKDGFEINKFKIGDFLAKPDRNPENECFCTGDRCLYDGVGDVSPCYYGIPVSLSQPHFLNADPAMLEQVQGLSPDRERHDSTMMVHALSGLPLQAKLRMQMNLNIPETMFNSRTKPFDNIVLPLFWVELIVDDPPWQIKIIIKLLYHFLPIVQAVVKYALAVTGVLMIFRSAFGVTCMYKYNKTEYLELPANYNQIDMYPSDEKLLESKI